MEKSKEKYLVYGLGLSGLEAALLLGRMGKEVEVVDDGDSPLLKMRADILSKKGMAVTLSYKGDIDTDSYTKIVLSPGIDGRKVANLDDTVVISEVELAFEYLKGKVISVTGSNGKSTTVSLLGKIFTDAGIPNHVAGNIGNPLSKIADKTTDEHITIIELSSFQLERIVNFKSDIALLLNLSPDHLDRYETVDEYYMTKINIFNNQSEQDFAVINQGDENIKSLKGQINSRITYFSSYARLVPGIFLDGSDIKFNLGDFDTRYGVDDVLLISKEQLGIPGPHNVLNSMAAALASLLSGIHKDSIAKSLQSFRGIPHRLEFVRSLGGVEFYNDSKSTNIDSLKYALVSFEKDIILIAGGYDKNADFGELRADIPKNLKRIVLIGQTAQKIEDALGDMVETVKAENLKKAVNIAYSGANEGSIVLLSPGCASYDAFANFEERGNQFKYFVMELI